MGIQTTATQTSDQFKAQIPAKENPQKSKISADTEEKVIEINPSIIIGIILGAIVLVGLFLLFNRNTTQAPETFEDALVDVQFPLTSNYKKGSDEAGLVIAEFSDYECPYCKYFATGIDPSSNQVLGKSIESQLISEFVDTGVAQYIYSPYSAVPSHSPAFVNNVVAAQCANVQGKFWEYHEQLYSRTRLNGLGIDGNRSEESSLVSLAESLGLNKDDFLSCYKKRDTSVINSSNDLVSKYIQPAIERSGQYIGTPFFVVCKRNEENQCVGKAFTGALPIDSFKQVISIVDPSVVQTTQPAPTN